MQTLASDLRYALRILTKSPMFSAVAVLTLGLGIGLNTTLFSIFNAVALKPLPVRDATEIFRVERWFATNRRGDVQYAFSYAEYQYFREHARALSSLIAASFPVPVAVRLPLKSGTTASATASLGPAELATVQLVSANYFTDLASSSALGRGFQPQEDRVSGAHPVVVLSYSVWQARLSSDPLIVGRPLKINDTVFTVVGVAPREFVGTGNPPVIPDFWTPLSMQTQVLSGQDWRTQPLDYKIQLLTRLKRDVTLRQAQAQLAVLERRFAEQNPNPDNTTTAITLQRAAFFGNTEDPNFRMIVALVTTLLAMVLIVASTNLANMLLARASARQTELAIRTALGATPLRLVCQLLTESALLALCGGAVGLLLSLWATPMAWLAIGQFAGSYSAFIAEIGPDGRVFAYTLLLSISTGILCGLSPALQSSRKDVIVSLKDAGTVFGSRVERSRLRGSLIAVQISISMLFLVCAGLLARGLIRSQAVSPGFETQRVYGMALLERKDSASTRTLHQREIEILQSLSEIESVAVAGHPPLAATWTAPLEIERTRRAPDAVSMRTLWNYVSPPYFQTLGIPLVRGHTFTKEEAETGSAMVAIVSEAMARRSWPGEDPIGKKIRLQTKWIPAEWSELEVVGVAGNVRSANLSRIDPAFVYVPTSAAKLAGGLVLLRVRNDPKKAITAMREALERLDGRPRPGFSPVSLNDGVLRPQILMARTFTFSALFLALLAVVLTSIGIYGVMACLVGERQREMGIRMALGASTGDVLRLMITQGMRPVVIGSALGLVGALGVSAVLRALLVFPGSFDILYGARWFDPVTFVGMSCVLMSIALLACYIPTRRATHLDPAVVLRYD